MITPTMLTNAYPFLALIVNCIGKPIRKHILIGVRAALGLSFGLNFEFPYTVKPQKFKLPFFEILAYSK